MPLEYSFEHLGVGAMNPDTLAQWYCYTLDAQIIQQLASNPNAFLLRLTDSSLIEIYPAIHRVLETGYNRIAGHRHIALRVPHLETAQAELSRRGVIFREPVKPAGGGGRVLFFQDLEGNLLHLVERPPEFGHSDQG